MTSSQLDFEGILPAASAAEGALARVPGPTCFGVPAISSLFAILPVEYPVYLTHRTLRKLLTTGR
jgi:hypothetical protein